MSSMSTRTTRKRTSQKPPAFKDFVPAAARTTKRKPQSWKADVSVARLAGQRKKPNPAAIEDRLKAKRPFADEGVTKSATILRRSAHTPLVSKGNVLKTHSASRGKLSKPPVVEANVTKLLVSRLQKAQDPSVQKDNFTEAVVGQNLWNTTAMEDFVSGIKEEGEEEGVLVLVVKEEPPDEQNTLSLPGIVKIERDWNVYTHNSDINNDTGSQESLNRDYIKEESIEQTADENQTFTEHYSNPYDENGHLVHYVEDGGRTCVQEERLQCAEDANEDFAADQVRSPEPTERTELVTGETYATQNPDVENFVLEKWLCGPQPDEEQLVELMMRPAPPLPDPLPYIKCEDSQEFRCIYCAYRDRSEGSIGRHYRQKHGPRYIYCFACGETFAQKVNLTKHEAGRCKGAGIATVRRVRDALHQSERWRQEKKKNVRKIQHKKNEGNSVENTPKCHECGQQFADTTSLQLHQRFRRECRRFRCEFCPSAYTSRHSLTSHRDRHLMHSFSCEYCGKMFNKKYNLALHIRTHTDSKRFKCAFCDARYCQSRSLMAHEAKHTGAPAPHICSVCDAGFWRLNFLKVHMEKKHGMFIITRKKLLDMLPHMSQEDMEASELIRSLVQASSGVQQASVIS